MHGFAKAMPRFTVDLQANNPHRGLRIARTKKSLSTMQ